MDITDPQSPQIVGSVGTPGGALAVEVRGTHVYVADRPSGLQILPSQCPGPTPVELSDFEATSMPGAILLTWSTAFEFQHLYFNVHRSTRTEGDYVRVNIQPIEPPPPYRFLDTGVKPGTTYFYLLEALDRSGGTQRFGPLTARVEGSQTSGLQDQLWPSRPNPFGSRDESAEIRFALARRTGATLRVYDATGRQVRLLMDSVLEAGEHTAPWDGRNDRGETVGSGVYFCRLDAEEFSAVRPLIRVR